MSPEVRHELQRLISTLCDDELNEADALRLNELLRGSADARQTYLAYIDVHAGLMHHPRLSAFVDLPTAAASAASAASPASLSDGLVAPSNSPKAKSFSVGWLPYIATAAATLAASLVLQLAWNRAPEMPTEPDPEIIQAVSTSVPQYVATLVPRDDCGWNDGVSRREGMRLLAGPLSMHCGTAVVRFDGGAELDLEGPIELVVDDINAATLVRGKVGFRSDESAETFRLNTPWSQMLDYGTEYTVVVDERGEELHVFDGEVVRIPKENPTAAALAVNVPAGEAWQFLSATDATRKPLKFDAKRKCSNAAPAPKDAQELVDETAVYEAFNYEGMPSLTAVAAVKHTGFSAPWKLPMKHSADKFATTAGLDRADRSKSPNGAVRAPCNGMMCRALTKPISLDVDGVHYFSYLVRADELPSDGPCDVKFSLHSENETRHQHKLSTTISWSGGSASLCWEGAGRKASLPLEVQRNYLVVGKIVASHLQPDQVFVRLFSPCQAVPSQEPSGWTVTSRPVIATTSFDAVQIQVNTSTPIVIDELRIGTTWGAVASAYEIASAANESSK